MLFSEHLHFDCDPAPEAGELSLVASCWSQEVSRFGAVQVRDALPVLAFLVKGSSASSAAWSSRE